MSIKRAFILSLLSFSATSAWAGANVVKVCNYRSSTIWAAYQQTVPGSQIYYGLELSGWFRYEPNQCRDVAKNYESIFWIYAKDQNGWDSSDAFYVDYYLRQGKLCVGSGAYQHVSPTACKTGEPGFREVQAHFIDFWAQDYNVYEIGFH